MKNEMGGACSVYGEEERCIQVLVGKPEENPGVDGGLLLR